MQSLRFSRLCGALCVAGTLVTSPATARADVGQIFEWVGTRLFGWGDEPALDYGPARDLDLHEEYVPPGEREALMSYARQFRQVHEQQYAHDSQNHGPQRRRGMHAKGHGCLTGTFEVTTGDPALQHGVFARPASYPVTARFSSGSGLIAADGERDLRGIALKLRAVPGERLLPGQFDGAEQDFLMTNAPVHHAQDIVELMGFIRASAEGRRLAFFATHPRLAWTLNQQTGRDVPTLVNESFWSRAAFRLGPQQAMRFLVEPCTQAAVNGDAPRHSDYLASDLAQRARSGPICYRFLVQLQTDPRAEPIEDHSVAWNSPAHHVATVRFPAQEIDDGAACEQLVYNPWNGIDAHLPLGNFNRARRYVYELAAAFRAGH
jgi:hypothetical protein